MARQPRLILPGRPHLVAQRGHDGGVIVRDDDDRLSWVGLLRDAAATNDVDLHAWGLGEDRFHLVVTVPSARALARLLQSLSRRHAAAFNRRHGRTGTLWASRYRVCLVQPGAWLADTMLFVETQGGVPQAGRQGVASWSSLAHHLGRQRDPMVAESAVWWGLGNTPFEREVVWVRRFEAGLPAERIARIEAALRTGRPLGDPDFIDQLQSECTVPLIPRPRGRPRAPGRAAPFAPPPVAHRGAA